MPEQPAPELPAIDAPGGAYRERAIVPGRTALLSVDMQNGEWSEAVLAAARRPGGDLSSKRHLMERVADVVLPNQARLQAAARRAGIEVMFTVIESLTLDGRDRSLDHKISRIHFPKGSWEARVIEQVAPLANEIVLQKTASGVFNATAIDYVLHNLGIEYLVIYGIVTDQCVESAIRDAADRGFLVTQIEDACAANTLADHERSVGAMCGHYCRTRTTAQMIEEIEAVSGDARQARSGMV